MSLVWDKGSRRWREGRTMAVVCVRERGRERKREREREKEREREREREVKEGDVGRERAGRHARSGRWQAGADEERQEENSLS